MKGKTLRIICVGKLKQPWWREAADHYLKLLRKWRRVEITEVKDGSGRERLKEESGRVLAQLGNRDRPVLLCDNGLSLNSPQFAGFLRKQDDERASTLVFIVGGPYGIHPDLVKYCQDKISLSPMTWPHELARVLLLEQLFRAESILRNAPYHH